MSKKFTCRKNAAFKVAKPRAVSLKIDLSLIDIAVTTARLTQAMPVAALPWRSETFRLLCTRRQVNNGHKTKEGLPNMTELSVSCTKRKQVVMSSMRYVLKTIGRRIVRADAVSP